MSNSELFKKIISGLKELNLIKKNSDVNFKNLKKFKYAYVIYNLTHRKNVDQLLSHYRKKILNFWVDGEVGSI